MDTIGALDTCRYCFLPIISERSHNCSENNKPKLRNIVMCKFCNLSMDQKYLKKHIFGCKICR